METEAQSSIVFGIVVSISGILGNIVGGYFTDKRFAKEARKAGLDPDCLVTEAEKMNVLEQEGGEEEEEEGGATGHVEPQSGRRTRRTPAVYSRGDTPTSVHYVQIRTDSDTDREERISQSQSGLTIKLPPESKKLDVERRNANPRLSG